MNFDKLIYGNDLDSLAYSFLTGIPIVMNNPRYPLFFEYFKSSHDLSLLNITNEKNKIKTQNKTTTLNDSKLNVFKKLLLVQSLLGKIKFANDVEFVRLETQNQLSVVTKKRLFDLNFDTLYIINDNALYGHDYEIINKKLRIVERFHVSKQLSFNYDLFEGEPNVYMTYGLKTYATVESYIEREKLDDIENSLFYVKHRLLKLFQGHGEDLFAVKNVLNSISKEVYETDELVYAETDTIKQVRFSLENYLCQKEKPLPLLDAYPSIVASKFTSMSTQTS